MMARTIPVRIVINMAQPNGATVTILLFGREYTVDVPYISRTYEKLVRIIL